MSPSEPIIACDLSRMPVTAKKRLLENARAIFAAAAEVKELPDGYALGFQHASAQLLVQIGEFIAYDRLCCAFLRHALISEPEDGTTWLCLTGGPGVKAFITTDLVNLLPAHLLVAARLSRATGSEQAP